jgi:hypothetical protein
LHD